MNTLTLLLFLAVFAGGQAQGITSLCNSTLNDIQTCATQHFGSVSSAVSSVLTNPSTVLSGTSSTNQSYFAALCDSSIRTAVKNYYSCFLTKLYKCLPVSNRNLYPSTTSMLASVDYLCDNINDFDLPCVGNAAHASSFVTCITSIPTEKNLDTTEKLLEYTCRLYPSVKACVQTAYGSCPKRTAEVFGNYMDFYKPQGCGGCAFLPSFLLLLISTIAVLLFNKE